MPLPPSIEYGLRYHQNMMETLVEGNNESALKTQVRPGKWTAFENIAHLSSYQHTFLNRLKKMLAEPGPHFSRYRAEDDPLFYNHSTFSLKELFNNVYEVRQEINNLVFSLSDDELRRTGHHPRFGELSIIRWCEFFLLHEAHHYFTIFQLIHEPPEAQ